MTLTQIRQQLDDPEQTDPFMDCFAWRGRRMSMTKNVTWSLCDPRDGYLAMSLIDAVRLLKHGLDNYMSDMVKAVHDSNCIVCSPDEVDWEYGTLDDCKRWLCGLLGVRP